MAVINGKRIESIDDIKAATDSLKMDWNKIKAVMESKEIWETIKLNLQEGKAMNVTGTPCYIINDEFIISKIRDKYNVHAKN